MSKTVRYIPRSPQEIQLYKVKKIQEERQREDKTNQSLIALRRKNLNVLANHPTLAASIKRFNGYINRQKHENIMKVINYLLSEIE